MHSGATICKSGKSSHSNVNLLGSKYEDEAGKKRGDQLKSKQCYECQRFGDMVPNKRWKVVKDQRACFSYLKQNKNHTVVKLFWKKGMWRKMPWRHYM